MDKISLFISLAVVFFSLFSITASLYTIHTFAQNITESDTPQDLPTGQESITVETQQGETVQAAPAEAIISLVNTLIATTIPGVIALILAILNQVRGRSKDTRINEGIETAIAAFKLGDTLRQKIADNYISTGAAKTGLELVINTLTPEQKAELQKQTEKIPDAQDKLKALDAQFRKITSQLPTRTKVQAIADNDKELGELDTTVR
jgi:hypothetical protein